MLRHEREAYSAILETRRLIGITPTFAFRPVPLRHRSSLVPQLSGVLFLLLVTWIFY